VVVASSVFRQNTAHFGGAVFGFQGAHVLLRQSHLISCTALYDGGALFLSSCRMSLMGSVLMSNSAEDYGATA
jgi:hypothetical protein